MHSDFVFSRGLQPISYIGWTKSEHEKQIWKENVFFIRGILKLDKNKKQSEQLYS
jgi:hypothetical protein